MDFLERVISNYFLAWTQIFNYSEKTSRIPFWHFYFLDGLIGALINFSSASTLVTDPNNIYLVNSSFDWSYLYSLPSFLVLIALSIRRIRDIGKENLIFWVFCSFIPIYNLYLFSQPSSNKSLNSSHLSSDS